MEGQSIGFQDCLLTTSADLNLTVDLNLEPHRGEQGAIRGMVLTIREVSERTRIQDVIDQELRTADTMHKGLLPVDGTQIGVFKMSGFIMSASFGAGDLYNFFKIDDTHIGAYMVDVMGHGIAAMSTTLLLSRLLAPDPTKGNRLPFLDADPLSTVQVATKLNDLFCGGGGQTFFTMCYCVIDLETGRLRIVRAGHPFPIIQRSSGTIEEIKDGGFAVGISRQFDVLEYETPIRTGDKVVFYSDGLSDCADAQSVHFSKDRLIALIDESLRDDIGELASRVRRSVTAWRGKESFDDDVALMVIQATGV